MALPLSPIQRLSLLSVLLLSLLSYGHGGAYYGMKPLPPQIPQYQPMGQQMHHMAMGKDGTPLGHIGKEKAHMPHYGKDIPQMPMFGKDIKGRKDGKGRYPHSVVTV
ncbi:hypothetical protein GDO78_020803 [Eleutherodactylus coqui]|uniref:Uncharacterized protein n=1 Tax=Eleutherodactylus coqui TaxID=57060 RepID=A0A8J6BCS8_ELECQ|nr:hypothetical protein GDO78_020803 [Eleutherodactylus coqui]